MFSIRLEIRSHVQHSTKESINRRCVETQITCDSSIAVVDAADCGNMQKNSDLSDRVQFIRSSTVYQVEYS